MNRTGDSPPVTRNAEEKEENHLDRILESNTCKKLFTWARPNRSDTSTEAMDAELREEQRLRWNFDFQTETPLPGRYQWVRTDASNGHLKNGHAINYNLQNGEVERRTSRQRLNSPYCRKRRTAPRAQTQDRRGHVIDRSIDFDDQREAPKCNLTTPPTVGGT